MSFDLSVHPRFQEALVGHQNIQETARRLLQGDNFPQSWIFSGPRGVGKATFAYDLVRHLFYESSGLSTATVDRYVRAGSYPNLHVIEALPTPDAGPEAITVERIRILQNFIRQTPSLPGWRVVLIDSADDMNRNAANALLKSLEEPPSQTLFILISHSVGRLLPTVRSRCCVLPFLPLALADLQSFLGDRFHSFSPLTLAIARGSLGYLKTSARCEGVFTNLMTIIPSVLRGNFSSAQSLSFDKDAQGFNVFLQVFPWILHTACLLAHNTPSEDAINDQTAPFFKCVADIVPQTSAFHWLKATEAINDFLDKAEGNHLNPNHVCMACFYILNDPFSPRMGEWCRG